MSQNAIATPHRLSAEAGRRLLESGGNAVDAAIAAVAAQGVVAPETCGVGGDLFALIQRPGWSRPKALNSSGRAGSNANAESLRADGHTEIPLDHPLAVTVPGCVDGLLALSELGHRSLAETLAPAIELADDGFEVSTEQSRAFTLNADRYRHNPAVSGFYPEGNPARPADMVRRPELAATLRAIAEGGRAGFYEGRPGEDIVAAVGGLITSTDLENSSAEWIEPIGIEVAGLHAWTIPPNSVGYLGPATLAVFEMLDPPDDPENPLWWHLLIEAFRSVAWERDDLVADPNHLALPANLLLNRERLERAAQTISVDSIGIWPPAMGRTGGTAFMCTADAEGTTVSVIQSNYRGTGSPHGATRSGFLLHDRGLGFSLMPGHPNELGPGKRPLHTLSPTLWTDGDQPRWALGTRGGTVQPQIVAQVAARAIVGGADLVESQSAPRWATAQFGPGTGSILSMESGASETLVEALRQRGHNLEVVARQPGWGPLSLIEIDGAQVRTAADPRVDTTAALLF